MPNRTESELLTDTRERLRVESNRVDHMSSKIKELKAALKELAEAIRREKLYTASGIRVDFTELTEHAISIL